LRTISVPFQITTGVRADLELTQERFRDRVFLDVDPVVGQAVAGGELAQPAGVGREAGADDLQSRTEADQMGTEEEKGAQQEVAETGVVGDDGAQRGGGDGQDTPRLLHDGGEVGDLVGQQVELADDFARPALADDPRRLGVRLDQVDLAFENDEEVAGEIALLKEHLTRRGWPHLAVLAQHGDLVLGQFPECRAAAFPVEIGIHGEAPSMIVSLRSGGEEITRPLANPPAVMEMQSGVARAKNRLAMADLRYDSRL
jgi:hypothetical protein